MRTQAVRLLSPYAMYAGAQVAPDSERPTTSRLYELIVGAQTAASARACASRPPRNWYPIVDNPSPRLSLSSWNRFLLFASPIEMWKCAPVPVRFENGFGMKLAIAPCLRATSDAAILNSTKLSAVLSASAYVKLISNWP